MIKNKYFLYGTAFFSGMSVMAIELGASRLLAPYFSSSQIVWTVIIGTIMIAMAIGNVWGGRAADKNPNPAALYRRLLFVAIWTAAIPFIGKYLIALVSVGLALFITKNFLIWASFAACILLFVFPLMMLGTVTPSLMKYATNSLDDNGKTVGELEALGTIGSIIGTFLPTFVTIPSVGTAKTFLIFAFVLSVLSLIYFISEKKHRVKSGIITGVLTVLLFLPIGNHFAFWESNLTKEDESIYNYLQVRENEDSIILSTNVMQGVQSILMKEGGLTGMYYDCALSAPLMAGGEPSDQKVLILGLGTGTYANQLFTYFPGIQVEGVEIDQKIVDLAYKYFRLSEQTKVHVADGRSFLQTSGLYDVIMVDSYQDITIPFQMSSVEFFREVKAHLRENGVMVVNLNMRSEEQNDAINDYLCDTIASVFSNTALVNLKMSSNTELFASDNPDMVAKLQERCENLEDEELKNQMKWVMSNLLTNRVSGGRILTDDKAPVEVLGMRVLDEMIQNELSYYKKALKSGDWDVLFD